MKNWLVNENVTLRPTMNYERNIAFEKNILSRPSKLVDRRQTTTSRPASKIDHRRPTNVFTAANLATVSNAFDQNSNNRPTPPNGANQMPPTTLKKAKKIPFGARGRRRSVLFIGLRANLDGSVFHRAELSQQSPVPVVEASPVDDLNDLMENLRFSSSDDE